MQGDEERQDRAARSRHTLDHRCHPGWGQATSPALLEIPCEPGDSPLSASRPDGAHAERQQPCPSVPCRPYQTTPGRPARCSCWERETLPGWETWLPLLPGRAPSQPLSEAGCGGHLEPRTSEGRLLLELEPPPPPNTPGNRLERLPGAGRLALPRGLGAGGGGGLHLGDTVSSRGCPVPGTGLRRGRA